MITTINRGLLSILVGIVMLCASIAVVPTAYAGECFTGDVFLKDYMVSIKSAVYLRSGPCSDERTSRGEVLSAGEQVKVLASNHGWLKVRRDNASIGWIWGKGWVAYNVTEDRFSANQYVSQQGYDISDTHEEFSHIVDASTQNSSMENKEYTPKEYNKEEYNKEEYSKEEYTKDKQQIHTTLPADIQSKITQMLDQLYERLSDQSVSTQRDLLTGLRGQLTMMSEKKLHLKALINFMIEDINTHIKSL